ncbi:hypothetical protein H4R35_003341 [Dimargaris xerosporica]|nr:hypothetical protein H4R35_003341 [Dimargaris xerosporica]
MADITLDFLALVPSTSDSSQSLALPRASTTPSSHATLRRRRSADSDDSETTTVNDTTDQPVHRRIARPTRAAWEASVRQQLCVIVEGKDPFMAEAYRILSHIHALRQFLAATRGAYLNIGVKRLPAGWSSAGPGSDITLSLHRLTEAMATPTRSSAPTTPEAAQRPSYGSHEADARPALKPQDIDYLLQRVKTHAMTEAQRDEIDQQAKFIIRQCMERIKRLEAIVKSPPPLVAPQKSTLLGFFTFSSSSQYTALKNETLAAHRGAVVWLLNKQLMDVSVYQREQQETRLNRELSKQQSAFGGDENDRTSKFSQSQSPRNRSVRHPPTSHPKADAIDDYWNTTVQDNTKSLDANATTDGDGLTSNQMELQEENRALLREFEDTLTQVRDAEKALLEISTLQSTLSTHLAVQTQETERLYSEAIATTERVQEGNDQLIQARQRNADTRKWILIFLIMASLILLFLDWFD